MSLTRRTLFSGAASIAALATLAACGGGSDDPATTTDASTEVVAGTISVTDANGDTVEVPAKAERVVTTHYAATQAMLDLGVTPHASGNYTDSAVPADYLAKLQGVPRSTPSRSTCRPLPTWILT